MIDRRRLESGGLIVFLVAVSVGLLAIVSSFIGALLWAVLAAILFQSLFQWLLKRWPGHRNRAAAATLLIIFVAVIIPTLAIGGMVIDQTAGVYAKVQSGQIEFASYFKQVHDGLPQWVQRPLDRSGLGSFDNAQARIVEAVRSSFRGIASQALSIGRNTAAFLLAFGVGLYVTYFLLRDGDRLAPKIRDALPLERAVADRGRAVDGSRLAPV